MMILLFLGFADFGLSSFSRAMLNVKVPAKWCSRGRLLLKSEYFLGRSGLKLRTFSTDCRRTLLCKNRGSSNVCARLIEGRYLREPLHPQARYTSFSNSVVVKISLQASWLRSCFHQLTNLVLAEWCSHVPDVAARSSLIIYGQVKRAVSAIHFFWTVTLEFLVIENWTTFVVCCLRGWIKCSCITIAAAGLGSSFWFPNQKFLACSAVCLKNNVAPF